MAKFSWVELSPENIAAINPAATVDLANGTGALLAEHGYPYNLLLGTEEQPWDLSTGNRYFEAAYTGVQAIYRVHARLGGSATFGGRQVISEVEYLFGAGDTSVEPENMIRLRRRFAGVQLPPESLLYAEPTVRDLGHSILGLAEGGRAVLPEEYWWVTDRAQPQQD